MSCDEQFDLNRLARDELHFRKRVIELTPNDELRIDADCVAGRDRLPRDR